MDGDMKMEGNILVGSFPTPLEENKVSGSLVNLSAAARRAIQL